LEADAMAAAMAVTLDLMVTVPKADCEPSPVGATVTTVLMVSVPNEDCEASAETGMTWPEIAQPGVPKADWEASDAGDAEIAPRTMVGVPKLDCELTPEIGRVLRLPLSVPKLEADAT
jgi:hypothetical protein